MLSLGGGVDISARSEPRLRMRSGLAISVFVHATILTLGLFFAGVNPFDSLPAEAITVDIVSPNEVEGFGEPGAPASAPEAAPSFEPSMPAPRAAAPPPSPRPQPAPQATPQATQRPNQRTTRQALAPPQAVPTPPQAVPTPPPFVPQMQPPPETPPPAEPREPTPADMFGMPLTMPDGKLGGGFDAPAIDTAKIERDDIAAFRNHLKSCSTLPAGINPADKGKIVLRIHLKPNGTLAAPPEPIEIGGASSIGPALFASAIAALRKCQPYNMLPADRYKEWKIIDLSFTAQNFTAE